MVALCKVIVRLPTEIAVFCIRIGKADCGVRTKSRLKPTMPFGIHKESFNCCAVIVIPALSMPNLVSPRRQNKVSASNANPISGRVGLFSVGCNFIVATVFPQNKFDVSGREAFSLFAFSLHSTKAIRVVSCGLVVFIKADRLFIDEFNRVE